MVKSAFYMGVAAAWRAIEAVEEGKDSGEKINPWKLNTEKGKSWESGWKHAQKEYDNAQQ